MAFTETLTPFFADYGVTATLADASTMTVIFDRSSLDAMGVAGIDATQPMCLATSSDVAAKDLSRGVALTIGGVTYAVRSLQPDGTGLTVVMLEVAA